MGNQPGLLTSRKLTTGKLYLTVNGVTFDVGNILDYKTDGERKTATFDTVHAGFKTTDEEAMVERGMKLVLTCNEFFRESFNMILSANAPTAYVEASVGAPSGTLSITAAVAGRTYFTANHYIDTVVVMDGASTLVEGTDYELDGVAGAITILEASTAVGHNLAVTYAATGITLNEFRALGAPSITATVLFNEYDQEYPDSLFQSTTGTARVWCSSMPEHDGSKYGEFELTVRFITKPVILARK